MPRFTARAFSVVCCAAIAGCASGSNMPPSSIPQFVASKSVQRAASVFTVLYNFGASSTGGTDPQGGPIDIGGTLYGLTNAGGLHLNGVLYSLTSSGNERVLYNFVNYANLLTNLDGTLYGTTYYGGAHDGGVIFSLTRSGAFHVMHAFGSTGDGVNPETRLTPLNGTLYGTTPLGGSAGDGTVFSIDPNGKYQIVHSFTTSGGDGQYPTSGVTNLGGTLYGLTGSGGSIGWGVLYSITPAGSEQVLYSFTSVPCARPNGNGGNQDNLTVFQGKLYGTCWGTTQGHIFSINPDGSDFTVVYNFTNAVHPVGQLVASGGNLYGVTRAGGTYHDGTIYSVDSAGKVQIVHSFKPSDGKQPTGLTAANGVIYGTAAEGGANNNGGTLFSLTP